MAVSCMAADSTCIAPASLAQKPGFCHLTRKLPCDEHGGFLPEVDVVMDLMPLDYGLSMGGPKSASPAISMIASHWPVPKEYSSLGTVHVPNTAEGVCEGVRRAQKEQATLRRGIVRLWEQKFTELKALLQDR